MHEMLTILTDIRGVCLSVSLSVTWRRRMQCTPCAVCAGSFGAAFVKCLLRESLSVTYNPSILQLIWKDGMQFQFASHADAKSSTVGLTEER